MSSDTPQLLTSIVVLCYNGLEQTTAPCLESILANTAVGTYELIVVDNASSDGTAEYLVSLAQRHTHIHLQLNETNKGYAGGNNDGIRMATGDYIVLLNNDTLVPHGWLNPLVDILNTEPQIGLVSPITNSAGNEQRIDLPELDEKNFEQIAGQYIAAQQKHWFITNKLGFFCVAMRRNLIDEIGLLDEQFGIGMFEDDDFCLRAISKGYQLAIAEYCFIFHMGSASFKKLGASTLAEEFQKNRDYFYKKNNKYWIFSDIVDAIWKKINNDLDTYLSSQDATALQRINVRRINLSGAIAQLRELELRSGKVDGVSLDQVQLADKHKQLMEISDWASELKRINEQLTSELAIKSAQLKASTDIAISLKNRNDAHERSPLYRLTKWICRKK